MDTKVAINLKTSYFKTNYTILIRLFLKDVLLWLYLDYLTMFSKLSFFLVSEILKIAMKTGQIVNISLWFWTKALMLK